MNHGMKAKTIKAVLRRKVDAWLASIEDEGLRAACKRDAIVTGGSIASMLIGEKVADFDVYFRSYETAVAVAKHYAAEFDKRRQRRDGVPIPITVQEMTDVRGERRVRIVVKSAGVETQDGEADYTYFESQPDEAAGEYVSEVYDNPGEIADLVETTAAAVRETQQAPDYRPVFLSSNAIMLSGKVQLILRFYGEPDEIHANYDFTHCTNYWSSHSGTLVLRPEALQALLARTLVYQGSRYPVCSLFRLRKFIARGWRVNAGQILKIAMQVSDLDLSKIDVLEDQLTGVDAAYFAQVLERCREKGGDRIESAYLVEIIDRMFGEIQKPGAQGAAE
jgi:hypothetical protein